MNYTDTYTDIEAGEKHATEEIRNAFAQMTAGKWETDVPYLMLGMRPAYQSLKETVFADLIQQGEGEDELQAILQSSSCPLVQKLRTKLCERWVSSHARDLAEARA